MSDFAVSQAAEELLKRRRARESFLGFCRYVQPPDMQPAAHHVVMCEALDRIERGEIDRLMICLPPGSAKSTYGSVLFPEYFLGRNPQLNVILAAHTSPLAERFGRRARNAFGSDAHRVLFSNGLSPDNTAVSQWTTSAGGEFITAGIGGSITGSRCDLAIIDDPVRSREDADSETVREATWQWYVNDLSTRLKPGGRIVAIATSWHEDDLLARLRDLEAGRWTIIRIPMEAVENDPLGRKPGERLWPQWFTEQMVADAKRDTRSWNSLYQQNPRPPEGSEFVRSWICRYEHWPARSNKLLLVDPSAGRSAKSDYTSMWVVALGGDGNAYVVDGERKRMNLTQRTEALFRLHAKWKPYQVRYEEYGMQADIEHIKSQMEVRDYRFKIYKVGGKVQKEARIRRLVPWFEGGRMWFPLKGMLRSPGWDAEGRPLPDVDIIRALIEEEYVTFPVGKYDDALDNLARLAEPDMPLPVPKDERKQSEAASVLFGVLDEVVNY